MHSTHLSANEMKLDLGKWTLFMSWSLDMLLMLRAPKFCPKMSPNHYVCTVVWKK